MQSSRKTFCCTGPSSFHTEDFNKPDQIFIGPNFFLSQSMIRVKHQCFDNSTLSKWQIQSLNLDLMKLQESPWRKIDNSIIKVSLGRVLSFYFRREIIQGHKINTFPNRVRLKLLKHLVKQVPVRHLQARQTSRLKIFMGPSQILVARAFGRVVNVEDCNAMTYEKFMKILHRVYVTCKAILFSNSIRRSLNFRRDQAFSTKVSAHYLTSYKHWVLSSNVQCTWHQK